MLRCAPTPARGNAKQGLALVARVCTSWSAEEPQESGARHSEPLIVRISPRQVKPKFSTAAPHGCDPAQNGQAELLGIVAGGIFATYKDIRMLRPLILATLLLGCAGTASAGAIYKWVDSQGITHFTAQPPQGTEASVVAPAKQPPTQATAAAASDSSSDTAEPSQEEVDARVRREVAAKEKERREYCTNLRTNLAQLRNNPRLRMEVNGEMQRLTEEERQTRIAETEKGIGEHCN